MSTLQALEARVQALEFSLRNTRRIALGLSLLLVTFLSAAFVVPREEIQTEKLILMKSDYLPGVALVAGPMESLVIQGPDGEVLMTLGKPAMRLIGDEEDGVDASGS